VLDVQNRRHQRSEVEMQCHNNWSEPGRHVTANAQTLELIAQYKYSTHPRVPQDTVGGRRVGVPRHLSVTRYTTRLQVIEYIHYPGPLPSSPLQFFLYGLIFLATLRMGNVNDFGIYDRSPG